MRALPLCALVVAACGFGADYGGTAYLCGDDGSCPAGYECRVGRCVIPGGQPDAMMAASWWNDAWPARFPLTIRNPAATALPAGFQIGWRVALGRALGESDPDAVRVLALSDTGQWNELTRIIDPLPGGDALVWFGLPDAIEPDGELVLWVYAGNPSPGAPPEMAEQVFEMADSFPDISASRWVTAGTVTVDGGEVRFDGSDQMRSAAPIGIDRALDVRVRTDGQADRFWFGFQRVTPDFDPEPPWVLWVRRAEIPTTQIMPEYLAPDSPFTERWPGPAIPVDAGYHLYSIDRLTDRILFRQDYALREPEHDHPLPADDNGSMYIRFTNDGASSIWLSRLRVRQAVYPLPVVELGAREDIPGP